MEDLKFDLQLFAEGEEPTADNTALEQPLGDSGANPEGSNEQNGGEEDFDWKIDPESGDVTLNPHMFDDEDSEDGEEEPAEEQLPPEPEKYKVKVNGVEREVTLDELRNGYMMHSDYTAKTQALAEEKRRMEAMYAQYGQQNPQQNMQQGQSVQPQQPAQPQPQQNQVDPKAYYKTLSDYAIKRVSENLGEDFDEYNPVHQAALADEISTIKATMYERNLRQQEIQKVYNKYAQDPNIQAIDQYAAQRLQQLPYQQAVQIQQALRNNDARVIDAYMGAVRDEFYRARGYVPDSEQRVPQNKPVATPAKPVPKQKPPFAESTGAVKNTPQPNQKNIDYSKLGKLTLDQQAQLASKLGLG